jgi:Vanillate O-demethylase oxygenase C-terminal domain
MFEAAAGRQVQGFLDVSHFAFIHAASFGEPDNPVVPDYPITRTTTGFVADYISTKYKVQPVQFFGLRALSRADAGR